MVFGKDGDTLTPMPISHYIVASFLSPSLSVSNSQGLREVFAVAHCWPTPPLDVETKGEQKHTQFLTCICICIFIYERVCKLFMCKQMKSGGHTTIGLRLCCACLMCLRQCLCLAWSAFSLCYVRDLVCVMCGI